tara:strand:- start:455 stop:559 length:105 start_codon:yes stop_codon:yes gene_type:complete
LGNNRVSINLKNYFDIVLQEEKTEKKEVKKNEEN